MKKASELFDDTQRKRIDAAITDAESKTAAEIVAVVATESGRYDRAEDSFGFWLAVVLGGAAHVTTPISRADQGSWHGFSHAGHALLVLVVMAVAYLAGAWLAARRPGLRRWFTPEKQMHDETEARARQAFFDQRVYRTKAGSGLLIYVSLYERRAVVLADDRCADRLTQDLLNAIRDAVVEGMKKNDPTDGLCRAIQIAGAQLGALVPRPLNDKNEISNSLVLID